jgi:membrane protein implicated in regulation of membrane protease activity
MEWAVDPLASAISLVGAIGKALYLFLLPGYALLATLGWRGERDLLTRMAMAGAVSIALYPLALLWALPLGSKGLAALSGLPLLLAMVWGLKAFLSGRTKEEAVEIPLPGVTAVVLALLVLTRVQAIDGWIAPAWGDSLQHAMVVQLLLDHGSLFTSWAPYAPLETFSYHFGAHTAVALWATLGGEEAPMALLRAGQALGVLAVLAVVPLARRIGGRDPVAGLAAVVFVGFFYADPGRFLSWGRYTQLAGMIILPVLLDRIAAFQEERRTGQQDLAIIGLLTGGLILTHYRVAVFAAAAFAVWPLVNVLRAGPGSWARLGKTVAAGGLGIALTLPWWHRILDGRLVEATRQTGQRFSPGPFDGTDLLLAVAAATSQTPRWLVAVAGLVFAAALLSAPRAFLPFLLWLALLVVFANPAMLGLPGADVLTNFAVAIIAYLPLSVAAAWLAVRARSRVEGNLQRRRAALLALGAGLAVGAVLQSRIGAEENIMLTSDDLEAFAWIESNVAPGARILVNAYAPAEDFTVVGSDAGWWVPLYTRRGVTVPPLVYLIERMSPGWNPPDIHTFTRRISQGRTGWLLMKRLLCENDIVGVFLGDRRGSVGLGAEPLLEEQTFAGNPYFHLSHQSGFAQFWTFDPAACHTRLLTRDLKACSSSRSLRGIEILKDSRWREECVQEYEARPLLCEPID